MTDAPTCAYCRSPVPQDPATCPACRTLLHAECVAELDACPTLGCAGRLPGMRAARARPPASAKDAPGAARRLLRAALLALLLVVAGRALDVHRLLRPRRSFPGRIRVLGLEGTDPALVATLAAAITREYGIEAEVVPQRPRARAPVRQQPWGPQLEAGALIAQGVEVAAAPGRRGVLVVAAEDIYDPGTNFVFGLVGEGGAVLSTARFGDGSRADLERRAVAQALSSTGLLLGYPRCGTRTCPRAYASDLLEHDEKQDELCDACVARLSEAR